MMLVKPTDEVLARAESPSGVISEGDAAALAAEVRRLRRSLAEAEARADKYFEALRERGDE